MSLIGEKNTIPCVWTVERKSAETDLIHLSEPGAAVALCQADNQRKANKTERFERIRCWTCICSREDLTEEETPDAV
jgi:hypothetical protein